jgi:uncharacterized Zn finger protein
MPDGLEHIDCPICGPAGVSEFAVEDGWHIVNCSGCGLLYVNPRRKTEDPTKHFQEDYIDNKDRVEVDFIAFC